MAENSKKEYWNYEIETMSKDEMVSLQLGKLKKQLRYNYDRSEFYRLKFIEAGINPEDVRSLEDFKQIPLMTKEEHRESQQASIEEHGHPYGPGTITCAPLNKIVRINATSGTTGKPTLYTLTQRDVEKVNEGNARRFWMAGIRPGDVIIQGMALSMFVGGLPLAQGIMAVGACVVPVGVEGGTKRLLEFIELTAPVGMFATPSFGQYLIEQCPVLTSRSASSLGIKWFFTAGEPGGGNPEVRKLLSEGLGGAKVFDHTGGGHSFCAGSCEGDPDHYTGMHFLSGDHCLLELVDPKTKSSVDVFTGNSGELVLTSLDWEGGPFMRYAYGYIVEVVSERCDCGRSGIKIRIVGRADDMLIVKGVNVYPEAVKRELLKFRPRLTGAFRIILDKHGPLVSPPLKLKVEHSEEVEKTELGVFEKELQAHFKQHLRVTPKILWVERGVIPRETKKTKLIEIEQPD